jgi:rhodanese-related sulfurtransferase
MSTVRTTYPNDEELKIMQETFPSDDELKAMIANAVVIDVRPPDEVLEKGTSVPGSVNIPFVTAEQDSFICDEVLSKLPADKNSIIITH